MGLLDGILSDNLAKQNAWKQQVGQAANGLLGAVKDPIGSVNKLAQALANQGDQNSFLMDQAGWTPGSNSVLLDPKVKALARGLLADQGANSAMAAATVWHGSPHKFDKFDASKIGTGEGAQAYGHGLYLAESPDVARSYQNTLSKYGELHFGDGTVKSVPDLPYGSPEQIAGQIWMNKPNIADAKFALQNLDAKYLGAPKEEVLKQLEGLHNANAQLSGSFYKVDLPDEHIAKMLDWDKPFSEQHPDVQAALSGLQNEGASMSYGDMLTSLKVAPHLQNAKDYPFMHPTGKQIYDSFGDAMMVGNSAKGQITASDKLKELGIPGIRYLDGGSRGAGQGSSNFVVFPGNEGLLNIMERNGQPVNQLSGLLQP